MRRGDDMSDEQQDQAGEEIPSHVVIYVLPTEEGLPPRAMVGQPVAGIVEGPDGEPAVAEGIAGELCVWSADMGAWMANGVPVPTVLGDALTQRAKELGVE